MEQCPVTTDDSTRMSDRVLAFLRDRSTDSVLGPRRFCRAEIVEYVVETAESMGFRVWTENRRVDRPDVIVLEHWSLLDSYEGVISSNPGADVLYGQDLCHQVPAVVRLRR